MSSSQDIRSWKSPTSPPPESRLVRRLAIVSAFGFTACVALAGYLATWWHFVPPVHVHGFTADYAETVIVPHPTTGAWQSGLAALNPTQRAGRAVVQPTARLTRDSATWLATVLEGREPNVAVILAAHGGCDADGPYLIPDDAPGDPSARLRIPTILETLARLPRRTPKLLVLDTTTAPALPNLGSVHNGFARGLEELEPDILAIPNLVVFTASGPDERSWVNEERGRTAFCDSVLRGLSGLADDNGDGLVYADELIEFATDSTTRWAWEHRSAVQVPAVYPRGAEGLRRAKGQFLAAVGSPEPVSPPTPFTPSADWERAWAEFRQLDEREFHPAQHSPVLWAEYVAWLRRAERVERVEGAEAAAKHYRRVAELAGRIDRARIVPVAAQTLCLPRAAGDNPPLVDAQRFRSWLDRYVQAPNEERAALRQDLAAFGTAPSVRLGLLEESIRWTAADPIPRFPVTEGLFPLLEGGLSFRPAEGQFFLALARHRGLSNLSSVAGPVYRRVTNLRLRAESVWPLPAVPSLRPWIEQAMSRADAARRLAEDMSFAVTAEYLARADSNAAAAEAGYDEVERSLRILVAAERVWQVGTAELPRFAEWLAEPSPVASPGERENRERLLRQLLDLTTELDALADTIHRSAPRDLARVEEAARRAAGSFTFFQRHARETVDQLLDNRPPNMTPPQLARWWRSANAALDLRDPHRRKELLVETHRAARQLIALAPEATPFPETAKPGQTADVREAARARGRALLARMGAEAFAATVGAARFEETAFEIDQFSRLDSPHQSLIRTGATFDQVQRQLASRVIQPGGEPPAIPDTVDRFTRRLQLLAPVRPAADARNQRVQELLEWQARRTKLDYYGGDPTAAYHRLAVEKLATSAQALTGRPFGVTPADETDAVLVSRPESVVVTDEPQPRVTFAISPKNLSDVGPGVVLFRIASLETASLTHAPSEAVRVAIPSRSGARPTSPVAEKSHVSLSGWFRGRSVEYTVPVTRYPVPHVTVVDRSPPAGASVAVRADDASTKQVGIAGGAIHFVMDASGSMRPDPDMPGDRGRYAVACDALEAVLSGLPKGVTVSVSVFGLKGPTDETAEAAHTVLVPPQQWDGSTATVMPVVRAVEPWHKSAVVRAILRAKAAATEEKPTQIVLISDCVDNRWADDKLNAKKEAVADALRRVFREDVVLHILAIPVRDPAERAAQDQFRVVSELRPAGRFLSVSDVATLAQELRSAVGPRVRCVVEYPDRTTRRALSAGTVESDAWPSDPLPTGESRLRVTGSNTQPLRLNLRDGDRLLLQYRGGEKPWERIAFASSIPAVSRQSRQNWVAAVARHGLEEGNSWRATLLLDSVDDGVREPVHPARVGDVRVDVMPTDTLQPTALRQVRDYGWPCSAWELSAANWPVGLDGRAKSPSVRVWWSPADRPASFTLEPKAETRHETGLMIESVGTERFSVEIGPGRTEPRDCLVVRFRYPPGRPHAVRPSGLKPDGGELRLYHSANAGTAIFWSNSSEPVQPKLRALEFTDLVEARAAAEKAGYLISLPVLPPPVRRPPAAQAPR